MGFDKGWSKRTLEENDQTRLEIGEGKDKMAM